MEHTTTDARSIFEIGAWFADLVGPILDQFANPNLGPALALLIIVFGALAAVIFEAHIQQVRRRLSRLELILSAIPDPATFASKFHDVASAFDREPLTKHGWSELKDSFVLPVHEEDPIANTTRPGRYLNRQEAGLHYRRTQSLPNLFVGLGLLFTFIGLVAALKAANTGITGGDVVATTSSLAKLLGAATAKFYTSIAGLACSIVLGFIIRDGLVRIDRNFANLARLLEERLHSATPESLASQLLEEAREQTTQLKVINTDIAIAIGRQLRDALDEALPRHLAAAASPLAERVTAMIDVVSSQSRDGVGEMIKAFGDRLEGATQDRMGDLAETLARLTAALDATAQRMGQGGDDLGEALKQAALQLATTVEGVRDTVSSLARELRVEGENGQARLNGQLGHMEESMGLIAERLVAAIDDGTARARAGAGEATSALVERITDAAEQLGTVATGIESAIMQASERAQAAVHDVAEGTARRLGEVGASAVAEFGSTVEMVGVRLSALGEELARTTQGLRELEARIAGHVRAISEVEGGTKVIVGALGQTATQIRTAAAEAGEGLRGAAQPLIMVGERLVQTAEAARRSNEGLERMLTETAVSAMRQAEAAEKALDQLEAIWQRHVRRFDDVDEQLGKAFDEIGTKLRENLGHLARFSADIDSHTTKAVSQFAGAIEELAEVGAEISKGVQALNGHSIGGRR